MYIDVHSKVPCREEHDVFFVVVICYEKNALLLGSATNLALKGAGTKFRVSILYIKLTQFFARADHGKTVRVNSMIM